LGGGDRAHVEWIVDFTFGKQPTCQSCDHDQRCQAWQRPKRLTLTVAPGGGRMIVRRSPQTEVAGRFSRLTCR
jgi:hypothetical protein